MAGTLKQNTQNEVSHVDPVHLRREDGTGVASRRTWTRRSPPTTVERQKVV